MKTVEFIPNKMSSQKEKEYLNKLGKKLREGGCRSFCSQTCNTCPFKNIISEDDYSGKHCLPDFFYEKDDLYARGMYGRFLYSYNYYMEKFINIHVQEEMEV